MIDFWAQFDKSYRLFSQFCNSDDWHTILRAVAGAITNYAGGPDCQISLLDVGCGSGVASQTVCKQIYARSGCFPSLFVVEPSAIARRRVESTVLSRADCGPLHRIAEQLEKLPVDLKVDAILFLHSTYYIEDLEKTLPNLVRSHLRVNGVVCALVLPEQSSFFLDLPSLPNCSDAIEAIFESIPLKTHSVTLKSRFMFPKSGDFSDAEFDALRRFWMPSARTPVEFKQRLDSYKNHDGEMDFQDHLLIGVNGRREAVK